MALTLTVLNLVIMISYEGKKKSKKRN